MHNDGGLLLRPGINFTNRAELKFAHAVRLLNELSGRVAEWSAADALQAEIVMVDRHKMELRLVLANKPPIDEWSLILGDAIHNIRGAFDAIIWGYATIDGAIPKKPRRVAFPFTESEERWNQAVQDLESVPASLLDRVRTLQPWTQGDSLQNSLLWIVHTLDIIDKHRGLVSGDLHIDEVVTIGMDLNLEPSEGANEANLEYSMRKDPILAEDGAVVTSIECHTHAMNPDPHYRASVRAQFRLRSEGGRGAFLNEFGAELVQRTREYLDILYLGTELARARTLARDADGPSVTQGYTDANGRFHLMQLPMLPVELQ